MLFMQTAFAVDMNERVMTAITEMPKAGGYVLTNTSAEALRDSFSWNLDEIIFQPKTPSYCTTATYGVFFKALLSYWKEQGFPEKAVIEFYKANMEYDGVGVWGRWNSNGPGTAKFFRDLDLGKNFTELSEARPGDFLKIYWNLEIGKNERAHSVVFLSADKDTITFWSSNTDTKGFGVRTIDKSLAKRLLFSRLERPENAANMLKVPLTDDFLASMLTKVSSWAEVQKVVGL